MKQNMTETITSLNLALAHDFRLMPYDLPDRPVFLAIAIPTDDGVTGLKPRLPAGRGLTRQQAMISAGAEAVELRASLAVRHLPALAALPRQDGLAMASALDLVRGTLEPVQAQSVYLDCASVLGEALITDANSTGCAAGATRQNATPALWECIERDALALWWHGGLPSGTLPLDLIDRQQPRLAWWLDRRDRRTFLLDLTTDIGLPVVAAVSADGAGRTVSVGSAARPDLPAAALAAVTEMVQTEAGVDEARAAQDPELLRWEALASTVRQPQFLPASPKVHLPLRADDEGLLQRLADLGHRVLAVDLTLPGDPLPSMRVLVPGLCAMHGRFENARFRNLCRDTLAPDFPEPF
ncbi:MAG: YcaO-like family protein [Rhodobacterales bacterium]|nr:YcaO-like family protein [Rhodobacterales bacterium]